MNTLKRLIVAAIFACSSLYSAPNWPWWSGGVAILPAHVPMPGYPGIGSRIYGYQVGGHKIFDARGHWHGQYQRGARPRQFKHYPGRFIDPGGRALEDLVRVGGHGTITHLLVDTIFGGRKQRRWVEWRVEYSIPPSPVGNF